MIKDLLVHQRKSPLHNEELNMFFRHDLRQAKQLETQLTTSTTE